MNVSRFRRLLPPAALTVGWLLMTLLINPVGDFPLNDDWSYGRAVHTLVVQHRLHYTDWTSMPLITQVLWGALFCLPAGFSFTALRISSLVAGLLGVLFLYRVQRRLGAGQTTAFIGAACLGVSPMFVQLSHTFMTDVPFLAALIIALDHLVGSLLRPNRTDFLLGIAFCVAATLVRHTGLMLPLAFSGAYVLVHGFRPRHLLAALLPLVLSAGALWSFNTWLEAAVGLPSQYHAGDGVLLKALTGQVKGLALSVLKRSIVCLMYAGLFLMPILLARLVRRTDPPAAQRRGFLVGGVYMGAILLYLGIRGKMMPLSDNTLFDLGLGPIALRDVNLLGLPHWPRAPAAFWAVVTALSVLGSALLLGRIQFAARDLAGAWRTWLTPRRGVLLFMLATACLYLLTVAVATFFDRHLLFLWPILIVLLSATGETVPVPATRTTGCAAALLCALMAFAVGGTHDYLSFNRTRWRAMDEVQRVMKITPEQIDAGFEFHGWLTSDRVVPTDPKKSWWWVKDDVYQLALGPVPGYQEIKRWPFQRWMPPGEGELLLVQRNPPGDGTP